MIPQEIIRKKRDGYSLSEEDLHKFFAGYVHGEVTDYQMSAMLMAIYLKGMNPKETGCLTRIARDSGKVFHWDQSAGHIVDKHSTGGIGDKTSIILLPLCILEGLQVPMMAGRGLGHTGGTLDKLESIPGMSVFLSEKQIESQMKTLGGVFMGQTEEVAALDKKLYAMRDVTATVESIPLIVASILSKKLAEGLESLVMDVKFGSGAFMSNFQDAENLAQSLIDVGAECNLKVKALLTDMNSPLGFYAGNALEIFECIEILKGNGPEDTIDLTLELTKNMVMLAKPDEDSEEILERLKLHLTSGAAFELFEKIIASQGGETKFFLDKKNFFQAKIQEPLFISNRDLYIKEIDTRALGMAIIQLGGGRLKISDKIDPYVGLSHLRRVGEAVPLEEPVAWIYGNDKTQVEESKKMLKNAYSFSDKSMKQPLIKKVLG